MKEITALVSPTQNPNLKANSIKLPMVVLVHGLHSSKEELTFICSGLKRSGVTHHVIELKGYTANLPLDSKNLRVDWRSWLNDLVAQLRELQVLHGPLVLTGISSGANLCIAAALEAPETLAGVVPLSTSIFLDGWSVPWYSFLLPLAYYTPVGRLWSYKESHPYGVKDERIRLWIARELANRGTSAAGNSSIPNTYLRENYRLRKWLQKRLREKIYALPILAIQAQDDELTSPRNIQFLKAQWSVKCFQELILKDCYHMICIDRERAKVTDAIVQFAASISDLTHAHSSINQSTMNATFNTLKTIISEQYGIDSTLIQPNANLTDLGMDSLTLMEFIFSAEDAFHLRIPEDRLGENLSGLTLQNVCDAIDQIKQGD